MGGTPPPLTDKIRYVVFERFPVDNSRKKSNELEINFGVRLLKHSMEFHVHE